MANYTYSDVNGHRTRSTTKTVTTSSIEGLDELLRDLADYADNAMPDLFSASAQAAHVVLLRAQMNAPMDQRMTEHMGTLVRSLKVVKPRTRKGVYVAVSRVTFGKEAAYAVPVELGHRHMSYGKYTGSQVEERPFLRPAADESKADVIDLMIDAMNKSLDKFLKG